MLALYQARCGLVARSYSSKLNWKTQILTHRMTLLEMTDYLIRIWVNRQMCAMEFTATIRLGNLIYTWIGSPSIPSPSSPPLSPWQNLPKISGRSGVHDLQRPQQQQQPDKHQSEAKAVHESGSYTVGKTIYMLYARYMVLHGTRSQENSCTAIKEGKVKGKGKGKGQGVRGMKQLCFAILQTGLRILLLSPRWSTLKISPLPLSRVEVETWVLYRVEVLLCLHLDAHNDRRCGPCSFVTVVGTEHGHHPRDDTSSGGLLGHIGRHTGLEIGTRRGSCPGVVGGSMGARL